MRAFVGVQASLSMTSAQLTAPWVSALSRTGGGCPQVRSLRVCLRGYVCVVLRACTLTHTHTFLRPAHAATWYLVRVRSLTILLSGAVQVNVSTHNSRGARKYMW